MQAHKRQLDRGGRRLRWLLVLPPLALLYPPAYAHIGPRLLEIPFFAWYQVAVVLAEAFLTALVFALDPER